MNTYAQATADKMAQDSTIENRSYNYRDYGESVYKASSLVYLGEVAVDIWYLELVNVSANDTEAVLRSKGNAISEFIRDTRYFILRHS